MKKILEVACFDLVSAMIAEAAGADRIELCDNYAVGGLTPSAKVISSARKKISVPLFIMIRPVESFINSITEIEEMNTSILMCREHRMDGIVTGPLAKDHKPDEELLRRFSALSAPMDMTFHRALDLCTDKRAAIQTLIDCGVKRVLVSFNGSSPLLSIKEIAELNSEFGQQIIIVPAGGIRSSNLSALLATGCSEFHSSAITGSRAVPDAREIKAMKKILESAS